MSLSQDLIQHALELLFDSRQPEPKDVSLRRAVSASYYALFHHLTSEATSLIAPNVSVHTQQRIGRWFEHAEMKRVCGRFAKQALDQPLRDLIGDTASPALQQIANNFVKLQEARHSADYDLGYRLTLEEALEYVQRGGRSMRAWDSIAQSAEANIFILSLLMWKNWDKERP